MGLDFVGPLTGARLAQGSYIAVQAPDDAWNLSEWVYDQAKGQVRLSNAASFSANSDITISFWNHVNSADVQSSSAFTIVTGPMEFKPTCHRRIALCTAGYFESVPEAIIKNVQVGKTAP